MDPYFGSRAPRGPAITAFPITPADNLALPAATSSIYIGTAGSLTVLLVGQPQPGTPDPLTGLNAAPVTYANVPAGTTLKISARCVMATGTTAGNIVGNV